MTPDQLVGTIDLVMLERDKLKELKRKKMNHVSRQQILAYNRRLRAYSQHIKKLKIELAKFNSKSLNARIKY